MCSAAASGVVGGGQLRATGRQPRAYLPRCVLLFFLCLLAGCDSVAPVVKIGLVAPFEGQRRAIGYDVIYSARLAVRELNAAGGIGGVRVALVALDDGGNPRLARETAAALVVDPAVVAVVGHWTPEATAAAAPVYAAAGLPLLPAGEAPLGQTPAAALPAPFRAAYEAVTPFDETPGPYAGSAYDGMQLLWQALRQAQAQGGAIRRDTVAAALPAAAIDGMTGRLTWAPGGK